MFLKIILGAANPPPTSHLWSDEKDWQQNTASPGPGIKTPGKQQLSKEQVELQESRKSQQES